MNVTVRGGGPVALGRSVTEIEQLVSEYPVSVRKAVPTEIDCEVEMEVEVVDVVVVNVVGEVEVAVDVVVDDVNAFCGKIDVEVAVAEVVARMVLEAVGFPVKTVDATGTV